MPDNPQNAPHRAFPAAAVWCLPLLFFAQYWGNTIGMQIATTLGFLGLYFFAIFSASSRPAPQKPPGDQKTTAARARAFFLSPKSLIRVGMLSALGMLYFLSSGRPVEGLPVILADSTPTKILLWIAAIFLGLTALFAPADKLNKKLHPKLPSVGWLWTLTLVLIAVILRALGLEVWEINPKTRDMLALVISAHDTFLSGENPYMLHQMQLNSLVPLTYLPGMWLGFLLPRLASLDIRWANIIADAAVVLSLWWAAQPSAPAPQITEKTDPSTQSLAPRKAAAMAFGAIFLFTPTVHWNGIYAEPNLWWGVLAVLLAATARRKWWLAAAMLGVAVSTRHFAIALMPFFLLWMWRSLGWRAFIPRLALFGAVTALFWVPFAALNPDTFWFGTYRWLREFGPAHRSWFNNIFGFNGLFYRHQLDQWLPVAQAASVGICLLVAALLAIRKPARLSAPRLFSLMGAALLLFITFNGLIWYSFYLGALLFIGFALASPDHPLHSPQTPAQPIHSESLAPRRSAENFATNPLIWRLSLGVLAAALIAGGWLFISFLKARGTTGLDQAREALTAELHPGDVLVDRSDWRVAFVGGEMVFEAKERPQGVQVLREFDGPMGRATSRLFERRGENSERAKLWLIAQPRVEDELLHNFQALGEVAFREDFGKYRLLAVKPHRFGQRLSQRLEDLQPTYSPAGGAAKDYTREDPAARPSADNPWRVPGEPGWLQVTPKRCELRRGARFPAIYLHPKNDAEIRLNFQEIELGHALTLSGGVENNAVRWDRGPVDAALKINGELAGNFQIPNLPGPHWMTLDTSKWRGESAQVELIITTPDDRQRWTCVDAFVLHAR